MPSSLAQFAGHVGSDLLARLVIEKIRASFPEIPPETPANRLGAVMADALRKRLTEKQFSLLLGLMQRVDRMATDLGTEALRQATDDPPRLAQHFRVYASAHRRALFCFLSLPTVFVTAEAKKMESTHRQDKRFSDVFAGRIGVSLPGIVVTEGFKQEVRRILLRAMEDEVNFAVQGMVLVPTYPANAPPIFQTVIAFGDRSTALAVHGPLGSEMHWLDLERLVAVTYHPTAGRIEIIGMKLKREGREALAALFNKEMLGDPASPVRLPGERYELGTFLSPHPPSYPPRLGIERVGITEICYRRQNVWQPTTQGIDFPKTVYASLAVGRGETWVRQELSGAQVLFIAYRIDMAPCREFPKGRIIRGRITRERFTVDSKLDADRFIVDAWISHQRLSEHHVPLFRAAG